MCIPKMNDVNSSIYVHAALAHTDIRNLVIWPQYLMSTSALELRPVVVDILILACDRFNRGILRA